MQGTPAGFRNDAASARTPRVTVTLNGIKSAVTGIQDATNMWAGGFHNRVLLALRSGLLNEMTWALNTLVKVSAKDALQKVNQIPPLQDAVVELLNEQLQGLWSLVSSQDGLRRLSALKLGSLASRDEVAERREIILGALHSLLNFSWAEANADELSRDPTVVTAIDLALKLGKLDRDIFWEIHRYALDLLDNVANRVAVDPRNDALVSSLCQSLMEPDRHEVASALRSLLRLCHRDANSKEVLPIMNADDIVERLVSFLLLRTQDEELAYYAVEMLQRIAHGTHGGAKRIYDIGGPIVLRELVQMLRNEARHLPDPLESSSSFVPPHQFAERLKPIGQNALPSQPEGTANSGATNADSSRASLAPPVEDVTGTTTKHWVAAYTEPAVGLTMSLAALHGLYVQATSKQGFQPMSAQDLFAIVQSYHPSASLVTDQGPVPLLQGVRVKEQQVEPNPVSLNATESGHAQPAPPSVGIPVTMESMAVDPSEPDATQAGASGGDAMSLDEAPAAAGTIAGPAATSATVAVSSDTPVPGLPTGHNENAERQPVASSILSVSENAKEPAAVPQHKCHWRGCAYDATDNDDLRAHILAAHVEGVSTTLECGWKTCTRYSSESPAPDRLILASHVRTHDPWAPSKTEKAQGVSAAESSATPSADQKPGPVAGPYTKPPPIAVICAMLLSNLVAQDPDHRAAILEEHHLSVLASSTLLAPYITPIMANSVEA